MNHYLLTYRLAADYLDRRPLYRAGHLALAWEAAERGELVLAGAVEDTAEGTVSSAALLFAGEGPQAAEAFAKADPYVLHGLVEGWSVHRWNTVVGAGAASPVRA